VPYPFAHPAAVLPLARPMGRFAAPSALAIGSVVPDLWYFIPFVERADSHDPAGLVWFCLPVGLLVYALFHLVLKQPLIALISPRLGAFTCRGLPPRPWSSVVVSLLAGALTHVLWDELTHGEGKNWLQHMSTIGGTAVLAGWILRKLRAAPPAPQRLAGFTRLCVFIALVGAMLVAALWSADIWLAFDRAALRHLLRTAGISALEGLGVALFIYCLVFQRKMP
jgi:uncharacterized membrane protein YeaQ/YmgE (transglycosylase-associated protein family)